MLNCAEQGQIQKYKTHAHTTLKTAGVQTIQLSSVKNPKHTIDDHTKTSITTTHTLPPTAFQLLLCFPTRTMSVCHRRHNNRYTCHNHHGCCRHHRRLEVVVVKVIVSIIICLFSIYHRCRRLSSCHRRCDHCITIKRPSPSQSV